MLDSAIPTSAAHYASHTGGGLPDWEEITAGVSVTATPVRMGNVPCTLSYLIEDETGETPATTWRTEVT
jgi:hypothetical protein